MSNKRPVVAICYDFDGTLSPKNMQEFGFFHGLPEKARRSFWKESNNRAKEQGADQNLMYMKLMVEKARQSDTEVKATREAFKSYGKSIEYFNGVKEWFGRIRKYGKSHGIEVEHYIISSGLKELVEGSSIGKEFKKIYACSFLYDKHGIAEWPRQVVNCTTKTQYLFRINKGIEDESDTNQLNAYVKPEDRPVPFSRMVYLGDGSTDIPCMRLVKEKGGYSIAVYKPGSSVKKADAEKLYADNRVNYIAPADYSDGSRLDELICRIIDKIASECKLDAFSRKINPQNVVQKDEKTIMGTKKCNCEVNVNQDDPLAEESTMAYENSELEMRTSLPAAADAENA